MSPSLIGLGHLPGIEEVSGLSPTKMIFLFVLLHNTSDASCPLKPQANMIVQRVQHRSQYRQVRRIRL